ncbi:MAG: hypothetical protein ACOH2M_20870 [Cypionkella sp.]
MQIRVRLLMVATALLYLGPLLAGLGAVGWQATPLFFVLFMLWLFILRPQQWPNTLQDWLSRYEPWAALGTNACVQLLLVLLLFGIGRGIGGALHLQPTYGALLPLMVSFIAIPFARLIWDPWKSPHLNDYLDEALHKVPATTEQDHDHDPLALGQSLIAPLAALPDTVDEAEVARHLAAMAPHIDAAQLRRALLDRHASGEATAAETLALILHTTDPSLIRSVTDDGPNLALNALPQDAGTIARFARHLTAALHIDPAIWDKCPAVDHLAALIDRFGNTEAADPLRDLMAATNAAQPSGGLA